MHASNSWEIEAASGAPAEALNLRQALRFLASNLLLITVGLAIGIGFGLFMQKVTTRAYESKGKFAIDELPFASVGSDPDAQTERELVQTLILSIPSREMAAAVTRRLEIPSGQIAFTDIDQPLKLDGSSPRANIEVTATRESRIGVITATSQNAEFAARVVNAILDEMQILNRAGGRLKQIRVDLDLSSAKSKTLLDQLATLSAQRLNLEQENAELKEYHRRSLPLETFPAFAKDATLNNLKTQVILVQAEYDSLATTRTRGAQLEGKRSELAGLRLQISRHSAQLADALRSEYEIIRTQETDLQSQLRAAQDAVKRLGEQSGRLIQAYGDSSRLHDIVDREPGEPGLAGNVVVTVDRASAGTKPVRPKLALNLALGILLGGALGFGSATIRTLLDNRLRNAARAEQLTGLPCLAALPRQSRARRNRKIFDPSPFPIGLGFLRSHLLRAAAANPAARIVGIVPAQENVSSSRLVADLAILLAEAEKRTLVVDLHFDRPRQPSLLGISAGAGLGEWLASDEPADRFIRYTTVRELAVVAAGPLRADIETQLSRRPLSEMLPGLFDNWDFILIDAPPVTADWALMLALPSGSPLLLVADARRTRAEAIFETQRHIRGPGWLLAGLVLQNAAGSGRG